MADNVNEVTNTEVIQQTQQPTLSAEVAQMMELSLNGGIPPQSVQSEVAAAAEGGGGAATTEAAPVPTFEILKEKFNFQSPDDAIKEIEELRQFKAAPPQAPITFENEFNEKLFNAIKDGKTAEVYTYLEQQQKLEALTTAEVTDDVAGDIIKLGMQFKYKDLTPEQINYRFNKQFAIPKEPVQGDLEEDADFESRKADWANQVADIKMEKIIEAKLIKPELEAAKSNIKLPEINRQQDAEYVQWKQLMDDQIKLDNEIKEAYKSYTPKSIETKLDFNDEANKIAFQFQYEPDVEGFNKVVDMATNVDKFFNSFVKSDGTFDKQGYLEAIYFATNKDKILLEAMKQSKNATIKASLPDNSSSGTQRQFPQSQELSEFDKKMRASLAGYTR